jgi:hypothetical protein
MVASAWLFYSLLGEGVLLSSALPSRSGMQKPAPPPLGLCADAVNGDSVIPLLTTAASS